MRSKINMVLSIHELLSCLAARFRNRVCEECNFSLPTFYRKMRGVDVTNENGKLIPALSNAEKDKIREIAEEVKKFLIAELVKEGIEYEEECKN